MDPKWKFKKTKLVFDHQTVGEALLYTFCVPYAPVIMIAVRPSMSIC